eukprot:5087409-Pleurochrysis_carterae.AAC.1
MAVNGGLVIPRVDAGLGARERASWMLEIIRNWAIEDAVLIGLHVLVTHLKSSVCILMFVRASTCKFSPSGLLSASFPSALLLSVLCWPQRVLPSLQMVKPAVIGSKAKKAIVDIGGEARRISVARSC